MFTSLSRSHGGHRSLWSIVMSLAQGTPTFQMSHSQGPCIIDIGTVVRTKIVLENMLEVCMQRIRQQCVLAKASSSQNSIRTSIRKMLRISSPNSTQSRGAPSIWERGIGKSAQPSMLCIPEAFMRDPTLLQSSLGPTTVKCFMLQLVIKFLNVTWQPSIALNPKHSSLQALVLKFSIVQQNIVFFSSKFNPTDVHWTSKCSLCENLKSTGSHLLGHMTHEQRLHLGASQIKL